MTSEIDRDAKVYVAGHRGMVGSAIVRELARRGYGNVVARTSSELDLRRQRDVEEFFAEERPAYVFLAAARVGGIQANIDSPAEFLYDNLCIQSNVIECSRKAGVSKLLFLASSCIYPRHAPQPMREECLLDGKLEPTNEGYALAKIAGLKMCQYYNTQYGTDYISVMPCNIYGYGDSFDPVRSHVVAALIRKAHEAKVAGSGSIPMWGTGAARRELMFVDDLADACLHLFERYSGNDFLNVGTGTDVTIRELAELVMEVVGYEAELIFDAGKPDGMPRKLMDVSRAREAGWTARTGLREGLEKTYRYYLDEVLPVEAKA